MPQGYYLLIREMLLLTRSDLRNRAKKKGDCFKTIRPGGGGQMDWAWLLALACPLMMLIMMKGMHGNKGNRSEHGNAEMDALRKQNAELSRQLNELKNKQSY